MATGEELRPDSAERLQAERVTRARMISGTVIKAAQESAGPDAELEIPDHIVLDEN